MRPTLSFTVRGGLAVSPDYFGSSDYSLGPDFGFGIDHLRFGSLEFGSPDPDARSVGFGLHGSARYIGPRDASDYPELTGLSDVDASLELGAGLHYQTDMFRAFADVRYGVIGHEAIAGDAGLDLILRPSDRWTMTFGPRVSYGNGRFSDTYFGVTPAESTASGLAAYDAKGGILGAGLELGATYKVNNLWGARARCPGPGCRIRPPTARSPSRATATSTGCAWA